MQAIVDKARAALLDARLTGEAALPSGHQAGASHPAAQGGFYMGEVLLLLLVLFLDTALSQMSARMRFACVHLATSCCCCNCNRELQEATGNWCHDSYIHLAESTINLAFDTKVLETSSIIKAPVLHVLSH